MVLLTAIWAFNLRWILHALRQGLRREMFMHLGLGLFLSMVAVELTLGSAAPWMRLNSGTARVVGLFSLCLAVATAALRWLAARTEMQYNRRKFGQAYTEYARTVPRWNIFKSLLGRRRS